MNENTTNSKMELKFNINKFLRICFMISLVYELHLSFGTFSNLFSNELVAQVANLFYWVLVLSLFFTNKKFIGFIFVLLVILKVYILPENELMMYIDHIVSLTNLFYLFFTTIFFSRVKYNLFNKYL